MPVKNCLVSFRDSEGFRHCVEVQAESLYEAAALAAYNFHQHGCTPGFAHQIEIEIKAPSVVHMTTLNLVREWLNGGARSPKEMLLKRKLKELLAVLPPA